MDILKNPFKNLKIWSIAFAFASISCTSTHYINKVEGKQIGVSSAFQPNQEIESFVKPYREKIDKDMNTVLAFAPVTMDKSQGKWQTTIGSLQADITLEAANKIFTAREKKSVDVCLLNHGGIRAIIPQGNVTTRTGFELMPFENNLVVVALKGEQIMEMVQYIIKEKKPHPLSGMSFVITKDNSPKNILIQNQPLDLQKTYYVATNDYLYNGGDSMNFFKKGSQVFDLDYKLRNVWLDYFQKVDTIAVPTNERIILE